NEMGVGPAGQAVVTGAMDIIKTLLMGYTKGADVKEAKQTGEEVEQITGAMEEMSSVSESASQEVVSALSSDTEAVKSDMESTAQDISNTVQSGADTIAQKNEENQQIAKEIEENDKKIQENQEKIQEEQADMDKLAAEIESLRSQSGMGAAVFEDSKSAGEGGENGSSGFGPKKMSSEGAESNPRLMELINQYNSHAQNIQVYQVENAGLSEENAEKTELINSNISTTQEQQAATYEVTAEQEAQIDAAANQIVSMCNSAKGAINEVKNMLEGNFPKLDQVTLIKLATSMTKSAICGTESGLLATAAGALGLSSVVSFGATAAKAAEATAASIDKGAGAAAHIATNAAGKILEQVAKSAVNQVIGNISNIVGVDLNSMYSNLMAFAGQVDGLITESKSSASATELMTAESLGVVSADDEPVKEEAVA
ncbi:hypothetical protein IKJ53_02735, partial [bacterium]|nr:hypothetical protein [bacterium]